MPDSLYSTSDVARLFEINRVTIYRWIQEGVVKAYKVGKHLKIPASEVERLWREFGFPGKFSSHNSINKETSMEIQKKLVMAVGKNEKDLKHIKEIFADTKLKEQCTLMTYTDTLEAALTIGKEKPDLLLIRIGKSDGKEGAFARKIRGIHTDVKVIYTDGPSTRTNKRDMRLSQGISTSVGRSTLRQEILKALGLHGTN